MLCNIPLSVERKGLFGKLSSTSALTRAFVLMLCETLFSCTMASSKSFTVAPRRFPPITALRAAHQCVRCYLPGRVHRPRRLWRVPGCLLLRGKHLYQLRTQKGSGQAPASVCERME
nr:MAG TPA: hypothetical protein [Caudoviricetes sp.]